jgi:hypothetical protein
MYDWKYFVILLYNLHFAFYIISLLKRLDVQTNNISISKFQWKQFVGLCKTQQALKFLIIWHIQDKISQNDEK